MTAPINGPGALADMRDIRAIREILDRAVLVGDLREQNAGLFRAEMRAFMLRYETRALASERDRETMLRHLRKLVEIPAERETLSEVDWRYRINAWARSPATRASSAYTALFAVLAVTVASCITHPVAHAMLTGGPR
tara:strand:+ start:1682 stop:2092 length:411 start_codon:yes stop_codon:yes gene_type:complete